MSHGQVSIATATTTSGSQTPGQSGPTTPQLVSVPNPDPKGFTPYSPNAMPRQAFAAIPGTVAMTTIG
jgi:hypothetical protein